MSDEDRLGIDDLVRTQPNTGEIMASVANCWWRCGHAGRAARWPLAAYYARRVRGQQRRLAILRPQHAERIGRFEREIVEPLLAACAKGDASAFERAFAAGTDLANAMHVETGHAYIRWVLPKDPPPDLDLT
ncbi:MAG TPA: hypothetical protein VFM93_09275 [Candidatus Limnocylindria bacterium]|nr:hypothetical protein [Candidatus Limnocylindria bacterium]